MFFVVFFLLVFGFGFDFVARLCDIISLSCFCVWVRWQISKLPVSVKTFLDILFQLLELYYLLTFLYFLFSKFI